MRPKSQWITRKDVALLLGVDISKVRRMQRSGELVSVRDERGVFQFVRKEIELLAVSRGRPVDIYNGLAAGTAFELFAQGKTWQEVMVVLSRSGAPQTVEAVRKLYDQFRDRDKRPAAEEPANREGLGVGEEANPEALEPEAAPLPPYDDSETEAWNRDQERARLEADARHAREQHEWEEARKQRAESAPIRPRLPHVDAPPGSGASTDDGIMAIVNFMRRKSSTG